VDYKLSAKRSEVKYGRIERRWSTRSGAHAYAVRCYNRAVRRAAKRAVQDYN